MAPRKRSMDDVHEANTAKMQQHIDALTEQLAAMQQQQ